MSKKVINASQEPKRYFGLHMTEGVAEYRNGGKVSRLFIGEAAIKKMNRTYEGRPIYVNHVSSEPLETLEKDMDGIVVKSFFNKSDGKHWAEFLVWTDEAHAAIQSGWRLSNAYRVVNASKGGQWHNVDYDEEVLEGEFRHLAIVENPRYEESVILTPDEFKAYNDRKEAELKSIENEKEKSPMSVLSFFRRKKEEIQNVGDLKDAFLELDGKEVSVMDMIEAVKNAKKNDDDEKEKDEKKESKMNMDSEIEVGDEKMSVKELVKKYQSLNKKNDDKDEEKDKEKKEKKEKDNSKDDSKKDDEKSKENSKTDDEKRKEQERFEDLKNAPDKHNATDSAPVVEINSDRMKRGQERYGSLS